MRLEAAGATKRDLEKRLIELAPKKPFVPSLRKQAADEPAVAVLPLGASRRDTARSGLDAPR